MSLLRVLPVEDERIVARDLKLRLKELGYEVPAVAASSEQALRLVGQHRPDVVLMDIRIDGTQDGIETALLMRERFDLPVVFATAHADAETIERASLAKAYGYVLKPFGDRELKAAIEIAAHKHKSDRQLNETIVSLEKALAEKIILLKEVHHRVKNNLATAIGMLTIQAELVGDSQTAQYLLDVSQRIHAMALVHQRLYGSANLKDIRMDEYSTQLVEGLSSCHFETNIEVRVESEPVELPFDLAIPCGLLLNELISNAFKHAFPGGRRGTITVRFSRRRSGKLSLVVQDDGVGLPKDFDIRCKASLGMSIVEALAHQLSAELSVSSTRGSRFEVLFVPEEENGPYRSGYKLSAAHA